MIDYPSARLRRGERWVTGVLVIASVLLAGCDATSVASTPAARDGGGPTGRIEPGGTLAPNQPFRLVGTGFGALATRVTFAGIDGYTVDAPIAAWTDHEIDGLVPLDATSGPVSVLSRAVTAAQVTARRGAVELLRATIGPSKNPTDRPGSVLVHCIALGAGGAPLDDVAVGSSAITNTLPRRLRTVADGGVDVAADFVGGGDGRMASCGVGALDLSFPFAAGNASRTSAAATWFRATKGSRVTVRIRLDGEAAGGTSEVFRAIGWGAALPSFGYRDRPVTAGPGGEASFDVTARSSDPESVVVVDDNSVRTITVSAEPD